MAPAEPASLPDYTALDDAMRRCGMPQTPAEVHGFAVGMRVAEVRQAQQLWQKELYSEFDPADVLAAECRSLLERVLAAVFTGEPGEPLQLALLLPQGIHVDSARLRAVRDWCQGFLFGFGLGGEQLADRLSAQARELLHDIAEFTRLDTDDASDSEENQAALIEVEEYLREGVMLIREELVGGRVSNESE